MIKLILRTYEAKYLQSLEDSTREIMGELSGLVTMDTDKNREEASKPLRTLLISSAALFRYCVIRSLELLAKDNPPEELPEQLQELKKGLIDANPFNLEDPQNTFEIPELLNNLVTKRADSAGTAVIGKEFMEMLGSNESNKTKIQKVIAKVRNVNKVVIDPEDITNVDKSRAKELLNAIKQLLNDLNNEQETTTSEN